MSSRNQLIMVVGPTGIGKTRLALQLATELCCPIISADSRQIYREMPIGTAAPTYEELQQVRHYMVGVASIDEVYSVARYEKEVMRLLKSLFTKYRSVVMCGGSMLYIDAIERGLDTIPSIDPKVRSIMKDRLHKEGIERLRKELKLVDPIYFCEVDLANTQRIVHALEVYYTTGKPYSSFRKGDVIVRPFKLYKIYLEMPRELLYERINLRTEEMLRSGWLREALLLYPHRELNALNTIGYKELFSFFDRVANRTQESEGISIDTYLNVVKIIAPLVEKIEKNPLLLEDPFLRKEYQATVAKIQSATRQYARQQTIYFRQESRAIRFSPLAEASALLPLISTDGVE